MSSERRFRIQTLLRIGGLLTSACLIVVAIWYARPPRPKTVRLTITAGSSEGLRHSIAESISQFANEQGIEIAVQPTSGSLEALEQVNSGEIDLALTQGGLDTSSFRNLRQGAVLHVEPLHLLVKEHVLYTAPDSISMLKGHTVNLSTPGSGTNALATELLQFVGIDPESECSVTNFSYQELLSEDMTHKELPDAIFMVSSLPSPVARELVQRHSLQIVELPLAESFRLDWSENTSTNSDRQMIIRRKVEEATIPAFIYGVDPPVPQKTLRTLGTRLQLVAHRNVDPDAMAQVASLIYETQLAALTDPPLNIELLNKAPDCPLHPGVENYIQQKSPVITEDIVEVTEQVLAIMGAVFGGILFVWQTLSYSRRKRRDRQFLACVEQIVAIENQALQYEFDDQMTVDDLVRIQRDISVIKTDLISQFQSGDIDGADALSAFLNHANDASEMLTRMILHERSKIDRSEDRSDSS